MRYIDQKKSAEMMRKIMDEKGITASQIASKTGHSIQMGKWKELSGGKQSVFVLQDPRCHC